MICKNVVSISSDTCDTGGSFTRVPCQQFRHSPNWRTSRSQLALVIFAFATLVMASPDTLPAAQPELQRVRVTGEITAVRETDPPRLRVTLGETSRSVQLLTKTRILKEGKAVEVSELTKGARVAVSGTLREGFRMVFADRIEILPED